MYIGKTPEISGVLLFYDIIYDITLHFREEISHLRTVFFLFFWECVQVDFFKHFRSCVPHHFRDISKRDTL